MKKTQIVTITLLAMCLLLAMNAAVADEIKRTTDEIPIDYDSQIEENYDEMPLISPYIDSENTSEDIDYDEVVGEDLPQDIPHILDDVSDGDYDPDVAFGTEMELTDAREDHEESSLGIPIIATIGLAGLIVLGLLYVKRR